MPFFFFFFFDVDWVGEGFCSEFSAIVGLLTFWHFFRGGGEGAANTLVLWGWQKQRRLHLHVTFPVFALIAYQHHSRVRLTYRQTTLHRQEFTSAKVMSPARLGENEPDVHTYSSWMVWSSEFWCVSSFSGTLVLDLSALHSNLVRLQEILSGSVNKIRLKMEQNCRLFLDINDLTLTFTSRLKMDAKCAHQRWFWIRVANYSWTPPVDWVHGYLCFEPGAWIWTEGFRRFCILWKIYLEIFFKFSQGTYPWRAFTWIFFFWIFL